MVLVLDTLFCHDDHFYHIIFKSHYTWQKYGSDMNKLHWSLYTKFKCGLRPWPLTQQHGSCSWHTVLSWWSFVPNYFQIPLCITKLWVRHEQFHRSLCKNMVPTWTSFTEAYAQSLSEDCDLYLWPSNMFLVCDTLFCNDDHLRQIIFKSHHVRLSNGPDMIPKHTHSDR